MKGLALIIAFLLVTAWQYRNNRTVFFVLLGTLFGVAAVLTSRHVPEETLQALALGWALCMLIAGVFAMGQSDCSPSAKEGKASMTSTSSKAPHYFARY